MGRGVADDTAPEVRIACRRTPGVLLFGPRPQYSRERGWGRAAYADSWARLQNRTPVFVQRLINYGR